MTLKNLLALGLLISSAANAAPSKLLSPGLYAGMGASPFPSLGSVGATLTLLDMLRFEAGADAVIAGIASIGGRQVYTVGVGAKLRLPGRRFTPVVGLGTSRQYFKENSATWGKRRVEKYLYPSAGIEWNFTRIYLGVEAVYVFRENAKKAWVPLSEDSSVKLSLWPNVYVGIQF